MLGFASVVRVVRITVASVDCLLVNLGGVMTSTDACFLLFFVVTLMAVLYSLVNRILERPDGSCWAIVDLAMFVVAYFSWLVCVARLMAWGLMR